MRIHHIDAKLTVLATRGPSGDWVAVCEDLNVYAQASTWRELMTQITEGVDLHLRVLLEDGELESFLRDKGWTISEPLPETDGDVSFDVPWELKIAHGTLDSPRSAACSRAAARRSTPM